MELPGILTRGAALEGGLSATDWRRTTKPLTRVAAGAYAPTGHLTAEQIHALRTRAVLGRLQHVVASHDSAAVLWNLPLPTTDPPQVHVSPTSARLGRPKSAGGYRMHSRAVAAEDADTASGIPLTGVLRTVTDCALDFDPDWGVVIADAALHRAAISVDELARAAAGTFGRPGAARVRRLPSQVSCRAESVAETLLRLRMRRMGLLPTEQVWIGGDRVDFAIEDCLIVEFDGRGKYEIDGDPARAHWLEKARNDRLTEAGYEVLHVTWAELWDEPALARRIMRALARARARQGRRDGASG